LALKLLKEQQINDTFVIVSPVIFTVYPFNCFIYTFTAHFVRKQYCCPAEALAVLQHVGHALDS
jgi:hypothetical protein